MKFKLPTYLELRQCTYQPPKIKDDRPIIINVNKDVDKDEVVRIIQEA